MIIDFGFTYRRKGSMIGPVVNVEFVCHSEEGIRHILKHFGFCYEQNIKYYIPRTFADELRKTLKGTSFSQIFGDELI